MTFPIVPPVNCWNSEDVAALGHHPLELLAYRSHLLGADPLALGVLNERMDAAMRGHPYVKSAIDMACWDILGQASGQSVATLMGGHVGDDFALYRAISQEAADEMASRGFADTAARARDHDDLAFDS